MAENITVEVIEDEVQDTVEDTQKESELVLTEVYVEYPDRTDLVLKEIGIGWDIYNKIEKKQ